jgi:putative colanic acid biosynthesis acetyltransferase WcaF
MQLVKLESYSNGNYNHGRGAIVRFLWMLCSAIMFQTNFPLPSFLKAFVLELFGSKIGRGLVIRSGVRIKQPWKFVVGDYVWIGESVWIDNLVDVTISSNVCISQGAMLLTGNHNYHSVNFDLITGEICLKEGVWIGAKCLVGPNVICGNYSMLMANSTTFKNLDSFGIYQGNPCIKIRERKFVDKNL